MVPLEDEHGLYMAGSSYFEHTWNEALDRWVRPGDLVIDAGAHIGLFSLRACWRGARVLAFEPAPKNLYCLRQNRDINPDAKLDITASALSDNDGTLHFEPNGPYGHVVTEGGESARSMKLDTALDLDETPTLIKIDVEGYECKVLDGMQETLKRHGPAVLCESNVEALAFFGLKPSDLRQRFAELGYACFRMLERGKFVPAPVNETQSETVVDLFCVPKVRAAELPTDSLR
jgi:FkbM family methyltransferase